MRVDTFYTDRGTISVSAGLDQVIYHSKSKDVFCWRQYAEWPVVLIRNIVIQDDFLKYMHRIASTF